MMDTGLSRRSFLALGAVTAVSALSEARIFGAALPSSRAALAPDRSLSFLHLHTSERLTTGYCADGSYVPAALADVNHVLRDWRANAVTPIDPNLLDLLYVLNDELGTDQPYHVICGYRTPETNAMLHERGGAASGVANSSLHIEGKAIDIRVPGIRLERLRDAAKSLKLGGVGYYPASNFVHVDTGRVRYW